jgi:hypothetical protein
MWIAVACIGLGMSGLASDTRIAESNAPVAAKHAVLEIMSLDSGDFALHLEHHWGGLSASHVYFDNHAGPFEAIVESTKSGVRVTFNGWEKHPFVATSTSIRIVYHSDGAGGVDLVAEAMPGGEVRVRPVGRTAVQGRKITIRLGCPDVRSVHLDHKSRNN